jgi:hypothetical protein
MLLVIAFVLGIANFTMHKAVLESGHPLLGQIPWLYDSMGGRFSLLVEFMMLAGSMLYIAGGTPDWIWGYLAYSGLNAVSAWLILTGRI